MLKLNNDSVVILGNLNIVEEVKIRSIFEYYPAEGEIISFELIDKYHKLFVDKGLSGFYISYTSSYLKNRLLVQKIT